MNAPQPWLSDGKQILGVERDPAHIVAARSMLQELGFGVVIATTLPGAVAACRARHFDLMIIGSSVPPPTAEALIEFVGQCGGPPSLRLYEAGREQDDAAGLMSTLCGALNT